MRDFEDLKGSSAEGDQGADLEPISDTKVHSISHQTVGYLPDFPMHALHFFERSIGRFDASSPFCDASLLDRAKRLRPWQPKDTLGAPAVRLLRPVIVIRLSGIKVTKSDLIVG
ncbi:hypothetical protein [Pararhizobium sp.]|uniref:hypothetical protein n=1 Tax=Pararhizobium sp. TaxID=1977563 RepID=UPI003D11F959